MHKESFGCRVAHHGSLIKSCPGLVWTYAKKFFLLLGLLLSMRVHQQETFSNATKIVFRLGKNLGQEKITNV